VVVEKTFEYRNVFVTTTIKHRRAFAFPADDRKFKPPAMRVVVDSKTSDFKILFLQDKAFNSKSK